jgi:hypothetical protein
MAPPEDDRESSEPEQETKAKPSDTPEGAARKVAAALYVSGAVTLVFGLFLGLLIDPLFLFIAAFALVDFAIARAYETGRIGPLAKRREAEASGDAATIAESDRTYNPYARED